MTAESANAPVMSVVLATDTYDTIRPVIASLEAQTIANQLELVLVSPFPETFDSAASNLTAFHSVRIEKTQLPFFLGFARADGVRAASAPVVFLVETHAYPDPEFAEKMLAVLSGEWSVAVPGFRNANPETSLSWAGFLSDYGAWTDTLPASETRRHPPYNIAIKKSALLEFGERMGHAINFGDEMYLGLEARGHRAWFDPAARIQHVNLSRFGPWLHERFIAGELIGGYRSARWGWSRRLAYALGSPLIPIIILARVYGGMRDIRKRHRLPRGTVTAIIAGAIVKAAGELRGYVLGTPEAAEVEMTGYEIRKVAFNSREAT